MRCGNPSSRHTFQAPLDSVLLWDWNCFSAGYHNDTDRHWAQQHQYPLGKTGQVTIEPVIVMHYSVQHVTASCTACTCCHCPEAQLSHAAEATSAAMKASTPMLSEYGIPSLRRLSVSLTAAF